MSQRHHRAPRRQPPDQRSILSHRVGPVPAWGVGLATLLLVAVVGVAIANTLSGAADRPLDYDVGSPGVGESAPDFELPSVSGERYRLAERRGRTCCSTSTKGSAAHPAGSR